MHQKRIKFVKTYIISNPGCCFFFQTNLIRPCEFIQFFQRKKFVFFFSWSSVEPGFIHAIWNAYYIILITHRIQMIWVLFERSWMVASKSIGKLKFGPKNMHQKFKDTRIIKSMSLWSKIKMYDALLVSIDHFL